ncbi:MAG: RraA family protein [Dermatophilaceae bacterium]
MVPATPGRRAADRAPRRDQVDHRAIRTPSVQAAERSRRRWPLLLLPNPPSTSTRTRNDRTERVRSFLVLCGCADSNPAPSKPSLQRAPGDVVLIAKDPRGDVSCWGGILSLGAVQRGVAGATVDGACRDVAEAGEHGFAVVSRGHTPHTARGRLLNHQQPARRSDQRHKRPRGRRPCRRARSATTRSPRISPRTLGSAMTRGSLGARHAYRAAHPRMTGQNAAGAVDPKGYVLTRAWPDVPPGVAQERWSRRRGAG